MPEPEWRRLNRLHWEDRVAIHLGPRGYDLDRLRAGRETLNGIEAEELPSLAGKRVLHLQCHFGADSLKLVQLGAAEVVGVDFSASAIAAAMHLAQQMGLSERARFVEADVYDALRAVPEPHGFDLVFVTWGAICWLPDIREWAGVVAAMLRPGGALYLADGHPAAYVLDDAGRLADGMPGFFAPYFSRDPVVYTEKRDYIDPEAEFTHPTSHTWLHPLGETITGLIEAGMRLDWLHEHARLPWRMFEILVEDEDGLYRWPDKPWLPLAFSLMATRR
ncbi:MAG: class I SAM-dependent methyltransferase [Alphaproteobacteria bacterium]